VEKIKAQKMKEQDKGGGGRKGKGKLERGKRGGGCG